MKRIIILVALLALSACGDPNYQQEEGKCIYPEREAGQ